MSLPREYRLYSFSTATVEKHHKLPQTWELETIARYRVSQFQLEAQQGSHRAKIKVMNKAAFFSEDSRRESLSWPFLTSRGRLHSSAHGPVSSFKATGLPSLCAFLPFSRTRMIRSGSHRQSRASLHLTAFLAWNHIRQVPFVLSGNRF